VEAEAEGQLLLPLLQPPRVPLLVVVGHLATLAWRTDPVPGKTEAALAVESPLRSTAAAAAAAAALEVASRRTVLEEACLG